jgi:GT2 family glycosyltransferase
MIQHPTCFIPRSLYQRVGCYDTQFKYTADFDLVLRYLSRGVEFVFLERILANFRLGGASLKKDAQKERIFILKKYNLISKKESIMRLSLLHLTHFFKKITGIPKI